MQAVVLAAGSGQRMRPLSDSRHKAMLTVGRTTILARLIEAITHAGVEAVTVVTGYRSAEVRDYLRSECPGPKYRFIENADYTVTNNIVSLLLALESVDEDDVLLAECDLLLAPGLLGRLSGERRGNVALVDQYRTGMDGTVVTVNDGFVSRVFPPDAQREAFEYRDTYKTLNIYRFEYGFCRAVLIPCLRRYVEKVDETAYYEAVLARLGDLAPHHIAAEIVDGDSWAEVDDPNDLAAATFLFEPAERSAILDRARGGLWGYAMTDFTFMKNAYFPTDAMLAALRHGLGVLVSNYGSTQTVLNEKLSWFLRCRPERVEALNGASQAFPILRRLWAPERVAVPSPTFGEYAAAFPGAATYSDAPGIAIEDLERLARDVGVVVVVNPNNPTGTTLDSRELYALASRHPDTRFLVDESFIEFSDTSSLLGALERAPLTNVVVLCSLSKTLGVPGLRIGYVYTADLDLMRTVHAEVPIWNMGSMAEYCIELLLKFRPELEASIARTKRDREQFRRMLRRVPLVTDVGRSGGNFLLVGLRGDRGTAARLREALLVAEAIDVRDVTAKFADGRPRLRVAVRRPGENRRLVEAICALSPRLLATPTSSP